MPSSVDIGSLFYGAGNCSLDIEYRFSCPVTFPCCIEFLVCLCQAELSAFVIFSVCDYIFQNRFNFSPMIRRSIFSVIWRGLVHLYFRQHSASCPFVYASCLGPSVGQIVISKLQVFYYLIPDIDIIPILIHIRDLWVHVLFHGYVIYIRNSRSK